MICLHCSVVVGVHVLVAEVILVDEIATIKINQEENMDCVIFIKHV